MTVFDYNGTLAMESRWLWENGIMTEKGYYNHRSKITVLQRSAPGCPAIIEYSTLPYNIKRKVDERLVEMKEAPASSETKETQIKPAFFERYIKPDPAAMDFYAKFPPEKAIEYYNNAIILNAFRDLLTERVGVRSAKGSRSVKRSGVFASVLDDLKMLDRKKHNHTLPLSDRNLRPKYHEYLQNGYKALVHKNTDNIFARKVTAEAERVLMSLAVAENNPYAEWVHEQYCQFLSGEIDIVDVKTGVLFDKRDFCDEEGTPVYISESTVRNYLVNPANKAVIATLPARNKRSVWTVPTKGFKGAHFATFPPDLIRTCIERQAVRLVALYLTLSWAQVQQR